MEIGAPGGRNGLSCCAEATERGKTCSLPTWRHHRAKVGRWSRTASEKGTANDQGHYRYCAVFLHGRYGNWSRNRCCEFPDLV